MSETNKNLQRQREEEAIRVKQLKEQGLTNTQIAKRLGVSLGTVRRRLES